MKHCVRLGEPGLQTKLCFSIHGRVMGNWHFHGAAMTVNYLIFVGTILESWAHIWKVVRKPIIFWLFIPVKLGKTCHCLIRGEILLTSQIHIEAWKPRLVNDVEVEWCWNFSCVRIDLFLYWCVANFMSYLR